MKNLGKLPVNIRNKSVPIKFTDLKTIENLKMFSVVMPSLSKILFDRIKLWSPRDLLNKKYEKHNWS